MARMHIRRRGRSQSKRPPRKEKPQWVTLEEKEIVETILNLYKQGYSPARIGLVLRDAYGIPSVKYVLGKSMYTILRENGVEIEYPEDLLALMRKAVNLANHLKENPKDLHNRRRLQLTEAKIRRLVRYYIRKGYLPEGWKYSLKEAKLIVG
ncbi:MAG: 30S ribosomal protein S15 [Thermoplasmata archaeon]|nr:30S ribosomal protein S15 [Thermoplasmata archaeon]